MAILGNKRPRTLGTTPSSPPLPTDDNGGVETAETPKPSSYEESREQRIRENRERMEKLGIRGLSLKLNYSGLPPKPSRRKNPNVGPPKTPSMGPTEPSRRSSRLQKAEPVDFSEMAMVEEDRPKGNKVIRPKGSKAKRPKGNKSFVRDVGYRPEVYTEEHEKLLGSTEMSWTLCVDGYGNEGGRIYDSFKGKSCHQCRQKTLGHRTQCSECNMIQGQFCGDCLYMRYGEHVLEAKQNPNWICPVCRGICNCSLCRTAKGWAPTGILYRKISQLGFKSVAHYLIQTRRLDASTGKSKGAGSTGDRHIPEPEGKTDDEIVREEELAVRIKSSQFDDSHQELVHIPEPEGKADDEIVREEELAVRNKCSQFDDSHQDSVHIEHEGKEKDGLMGKKETPCPERSIAPLKSRDNNIAPVIDYKLENKALLATKSSSDSTITGINEGNGCDYELVNSKDELVNSKDEIVDSKVSLAANKTETVDCMVLLAANKTGTASKLRKKRAVAEPDPDSVGGRLRQRHRKDRNLGDGDNLIVKDGIVDSKVSPAATGTASKVRKKQAVAEPDPGNVRGRLRQRHRKDSNLGDGRISK